MEQVLPDVLGLPLTDAILYLNKMQKKYIIEYTRPLLQKNVLFEDYYVVRQTFKQESKEILLLVAQKMAKEV